MSICKGCGQKYSWLNDKGTGLCPKCHEAKLEKDEAEREARMREYQAKVQEKADVLLPELFSRLAPDEKADLLAAVCWSNAASSLSTLRGKALGAAVLGPIGLQTAPLDLKFGLIALAGRELILFEMGIADAKTLSLETLEEYLRPKPIGTFKGVREQPGQVKVKRFPLEKTKGDYDPRSMVLFLGRPHTHALLFPPGLGIRNPEKGEAIARLLGVDLPEGGDPAQFLRECPRCQAKYNVQEYDPGAAVWKCSACRGELPREAKS